MRNEQLLQSHTLSTVIFYQHKPMFQKSNFCAVNACFYDLMYVHSGTVKKVDDINSNVHRRERDLVPSG